MEIFGYQLPNWLTFKHLIVGMALLFWVVLSRPLLMLLLSGVGRMVKKTKTKVDDIFFEEIKNPLYIFLLLGGFWLGVEIIGISISQIKYLNKIFPILLILTIFYAISKIGLKILSYYASRNQELKPVIKLASQILRWSIYGLGLILILDVLKVSIAPFLTTLGVGGVVIGLALQDTLGNFFSGAYMLIDRPVRVGDYVRLESGEEGYVHKIGWRSTWIRALANNVFVIPNNKMANSIVTNYYFPDPMMSLLIKIGVSYNSDPQQVEDILIEEALKTSDEVEGLLKEPAPFVRFIPGFNDFSLDFTLIVKVREFVDQYLAQHILRKNIFRRFKAEGIEIPFPIRTVYLKNPPQEKS